ncbi:hypothetical protein CVT25_015608 [Psilocybe cyanescens]|uniref:Mso1 N-terminal domain-containing protein n=1 Tax=Psilocybe cyanescens TaxID=93625 RepID=A0A409WHS8_PSICY|nr:hypothetical protein CVT25_015608 [Psilocybe cyanescens]
MFTATRVAPGLPSNPRSRLASRTAPPSRQTESPRPSRANVAIPSTPRPRNPSTQRAPVPDTNSRNYRSQQRNAHDGMINVRRSEGSTSTSSSSDASSWPRAKHSQSSSGATLRGDDGMERSEQVKPNRGEETRVNNSYYDGGFTWSRVTEAATMITQEVSKAWAAGLTLQGNEDNDEAGESHLTRVMRAYHLSKARTPSELPAWLFSEKERGQGSLLRFDRLDSHDDDSQVREPAQRRNQPAYGNSTTPLVMQSQRNKNIQNTKPFSLNAPAKVSGSDRLKQMRELRRNAASSTVQYS